MSNNIPGYFSLIPSFRIGGLATGLDTDQIVSDLMRVERLPLERLYQKRQLAEWKRDAYREITNLLRGFKDEFFNLLKPSTNMLSPSSYKKFAGTSTNSEIVTVTGNADAFAGSHTVTVISLATADKAVSSGKVSAALEGGAVTGYNLSGKKIRIDLDGVEREITLSDYDSLEDLVTREDTGLQALVDKAFGAGKIVIGYDEGTGAIKFTEAGGASRITLLSGSSDDGLSSLGFRNGDSNRIDINLSLDALKNRFANGLTFDGDKISFTINSKKFTFDKSETLAGMMRAINADETAKVNISYDETTDTFTIVARQLGAGDNIIIGTEQSGNFFGPGGAAGINTGSASTIEGTDAEVIIDGVTLRRSSNSFYVNGIFYNLHKAHDDPSVQSETVSLGLDVDGVFENIKSFIDKYNEIIGKINEALSEKHDRNYQPLTEEQKRAMNDDDIKKWEERAKTGLLRNDRLLQDIVYSMRRALLDRIEGVSLTLSDIGIKSGSYHDQGKLTIDEIKLKEAIRKDPEGVVRLFSQKSEIEENIDLTASQRAERYNNEGLAYRLFDIIEDNIRTIRDKDGKKGLLLERAGMVGDASEFNNKFYREINDYNDEIKELTMKLVAKENNYYKKFAAMEKIIGQMNAQSNWLFHQFNQQ